MHVPFGTLRICPEKGLGSLWGSNDQESFRKELNISMSYVGSHWSESGIETFMPYSNVVLNPCPH